MRWTLISGVIESTTTEVHSIMHPLQSPPPLLKKQKQKEKC